MNKNLIFFFVFTISYSLIAQDRMSSIEGVSTGSFPAGFIETSTKVFFKATHEYSGRELYCFDKDTKAVNIIGDFFEGPTSTFDNYYPWNLGKAGEFSCVKFSDKVYFLGKNKSIYDIPQIYTTDGKTTKIRKDLSDKIEGTPFQIYAIDSFLIIFTINTSKNKIGVWKSDGTDSNMSQMVEISYFYHPFNLPNIYFVKNNNDILQFSTYQSENNYTEYSLNLYTYILTQKPYSPKYDYYGSITQNECFSYEIKQDTVRFTKSDAGISKTLSQTIYGQFAILKALATTDPDLCYVILKKYSGQYLIYRLDFMKNKIDFISEFISSPRGLPLYKIINQKLVFVDATYANNETITSVKSLDLETKEIRSLKSWKYNSVSSKENYTYFNFDEATIFVSNGNKVILNLKVVDVKNNFQSYNESWQIDINDGKASKIVGFVLATNELVQISDENILVSGSSDSLLLTPEPFLISLQNAKATQVAKIDKGKNFFNSANLEKYVVFWRKNKKGGTEIFSSNGSKSEIKLIGKIDDMFAGRAIVVNNHVFLLLWRTYDNNLGTTQLQLFVTDGTSQNTFISGAIIHGNRNPYYQMDSYQNKLYFTTYDKNSKRKFIVSDGTKQNTQFLDNPLNNFYDFFPSESEKYLYFVADDSKGRSLYRARDLDQKFTRLFTKTPVSEKYYENGFTLVNPYRNPIIFNYRLTDYQISNSDGEELIVIPTDNDNISFRKTYVIGKLSFFYFSDKKDRLTKIWQSDGTVAGTRLVTNPKMLKVLSPFDSNSNQVAQSDRVIVFVNQGDKTEKWLTDGSEENTFQIEDERDIYKLYPDKKAFIAPTNPFQNALWVTNGSREGTYKKIDSVSYGDRSSTQGLIFENKSYFAVWKNGKFLVYDIKADTLKSLIPDNISKYRLPYNFGILGNDFLFFSNDKEISTQLWRFYIDETKELSEEKRINNLNFIVFPNPTNDKLVINYLPKSSIIEIVVYNLLGKPIKNVALESPFPEELSIYLSDLPAGSYILSLKDGNEIISKRVIKF